MYAIFCQTRPQDKKDKFYLNWFCFLLLTTLLFGEMRMSKIFRLSPNWNSPKSKDITDLSSVFAWAHRTWQKSGSVCIRLICLVVRLMRWCLESTQYSAMSHLFHSECSSVPVVRSSYLLKLSVYPISFSID